MLILFFEMLMLGCASAQARDLSAIADQDVKYAEIEASLALLPSGLSVG
jgi:hypothetical protein